MEDGLQLVFEGAFRWTSVSAGICYQQLGLTGIKAHPPRDFFCLDRCFPAEVGPYYKFGLDTISHMVVLSQGPAVHQASWLDKRTWCPTGHCWKKDWLFLKLCFKMAEPPQLYYVYTCTVLSTPDWDTCQSSVDFMFFDIRIVLYTGERVCDAP